MNAELCKYCGYSIAYCECSPMNKPPTSKPECPSCKKDTSIYCIECGSDSISCNCQDDFTDWYCLSCDTDFVWDTYFDTAYTDEPDVTQDKDGKWWYSGGSEVKCYCHVPQATVCHVCQVSRPTVKENWNPWVEKEITSVGVGSHWGRCDHLMHEIKMNTVTVYASSLNDRREDNLPDWGLYADWSWQPFWRNEHIDWKDLGLPTNFDIAFDQIDYAYRLAQSGHIVEIGCIGGHGRTGTILSCMAVLDGMTAKEAMDYVRKHYCGQVVETFEQEWFVRWFEAVANGQEIPEKPESMKPKPPTATCSIMGHFDLIEYGLTCTKFKCTTFERDKDWHSRSYLGKKPVETPTVGTIKDGYVYTVSGWQATFSSQITETEKR